MLDETGTYAPLGLAEALAREGADVHVVTPGPTVGAEAAAELELPHVVPRLRELGVELTVWHDIGAIDGRRVVLDDVWGGAPSVVDDVDAIVLAMQRTPSNELFPAYSLPQLREDALEKYAEALEELGEAAEPAEAA